MAIFFIIFTVPLIAGERENLRPSLRVRHRE